MDCPSEALGPGLIGDDPAGAGADTVGRLLPAGDVIRLVERTLTDERRQVLRPQVDLYKETVFIVTNTES